METIGKKRKGEVLEVYQKIGKHPEILVWSFGFFKGGGGLVLAKASDVISNILSIRKSCLPSNLWLIDFVSGKYLG